MNMDLQTAYERIQNSKSPIEEVGTIIIETGGQWNPAEAADPTKRSRYTYTRSRCGNRCCGGAR